MAQHDYVIANGTGAAVRSDLNNALAAIVSQNSGSTEPATTYAYMMWPDTTAGVMKMRNGANSAWIELFELDGEFGSKAFNGNITLNAQGDLRFADSDSSNWVAFQSPATVSSNVTWTLPSADGTNGQALTTNGSGTLSWTSPAATTDKITEGNTEAEVVDTGSDGHFKVTTEGTERMRIDSSGRVGIGTISADANSQLHVVGSSYQPLYINTTGTGGGGAAFLCSGTQALYVGTAGGSWLTGSSTADGLIRSEANLIFGIGNSEKTRLDSSGRLLVGTSSDVSNGSSNVKAQIIESDFGALALGRSGTTINNGTTIGDLRFYGNSGNTAAYGLFAQITCTADGSASSNTDNPGRLTFSTTADGASSPTERMRISSAGEILLNKTSDTLANAGWAVNINGRGQLTCSGDGAPVLRLNHTGSGGTQYPIEFFKNGSQVGSVSITASATAYNTSSDYRLKENVVPLTGAVDRLLQIPVHRFNFIADPDHTVDGFIAHEAQAVVPECVTGTKDEVDADGNPIYQGIDQSKLVPLLTAALQETIAELQALKAEVAALKGA
jgi:hypothetical protein